MKTIFICLIALIGLSAQIYADFPAEEVWHVDFNSPALKIGASWEDNGQWFFLVGLPTKAVIVSEGEIVWESDTLIGTLQTLNRVIWQGNQIIALATLHADTGKIFTIEGEDLDELHEFRFQRWNYFGRYEYGPDMDYWITDRRYIQYIFPYPDDNEGDLKLIIINKYSSTSYQHGAGSNNSNNVGEVHTIGDYGDILVLSNGIYIPEDIKSASQGIPMIGISNNGVASTDRWGSTRYSRYWYVYLLSEFLEINVEKRFGRIEHQYNILPYACMGLAITSSQTDADSSISIIYTGTDASPQMCKLSTDSLLWQNWVRLPILSRKSYNSMFNYCDVNGIWYLLCIGDQGSIVTIQSDSLNFLRNDYVFHGSNIDALVDNFDEDPINELVYLGTRLNEQNSSLYFYDLGTVYIHPSENQEIPTIYSILSAYPNPFNSQVYLQFSLPSPSWTNIVIHDTNGNRIRRDYFSYLTSGEHTWNWSGLDDSGYSLPTGTYFCSISNIHGTNTQKLLLIR